MKPYVDIFKKPLDREEVGVATQIIVTYNEPTVMVLVQQMRIGVSKAFTILKLLEDARIITPLKDNKRTVIIKRPDMAINAAFRQLKKGES